MSTVVAGLDISTQESKMAAGISRLLDDYADVKDNDQVAIVYAPDTRDYVARILIELQLRGITSTAIGMRPFIDKGLREDLRARLPRPDEVSQKLVVLTLETDSMSHFDVFAEIMDVYGKSRSRIVRIISASDKLFEEGLLPTPRELSLRNATLLSKISGESSIHVATDSGSDLEIGLDPKYDWISNRGTWRPGTFMILPAGEIATFPARVDGTLIADGAVHCNIATRIDMRLAETPLSIEMVDSRVVAFDCADPDIRRLATGAFDRPNGRIVGELGFGTNFGPKTFVPENSHLNERFPGLHLGFGQHNQRKSIVPYEARIHLDVITNGASIRLGSNGQFIDLLNFQPVAGINHPALIRDLDITGDCCSSGCTMGMTSI